jgi:hypothetical protein
VPISSNGGVQLYGLMRVGTTMSFNNAGGTVGGSPARGRGGSTGAALDGRRVVSAVSLMNGKGKLSWAGNSRTMYELAAPAVFVTEGAPCTFVATEEKTVLATFGSATSEAAAATS